MESEIFDTIYRLGGLVILAGALLTGIVMPKMSHENVMKERDKADLIRDQRLEDQKVINKELTTVLSNTADALKRLADLAEARDRIEGRGGNNAV